MLGLLKGLISRLAGRGKIISTLVSQWGSSYEPYISQAPTADQLLWRVAGNVYNAISLIASCVADVATPHLFVTRRGSRVGTKRSRYQKDFVAPFPIDEAEEIFEHPALKILQKPCPLYPQFKFFEAISLYMDAARFIGVIYKDPTGNPAEIWPFPPGPFKPILRPDSLIDHWTYGLGSTSVRFETDEVLLITRTGAATTTIEAIMGHPPLRAILRASDASARLMEHLDNLLANRSVPDLHIQVKGGSSQERRTRAREQWNEAQGGRNLGQPLFTGEDTMIEPIGYSPKDGDYIQAERMIRELICNAFHVPVQLFTSESVPRANLEGGLYQLAKFAIKPRLRLINDALNTFIMPLFPNSERLFYAFDDPVPEDHALANATIVTLSSARIATKNELRAIAGLEPVDWGDEPPQEPEPMQDDGEDDQQSDDDEPPAKRFKSPETEPGSKPKARGLKTILRDYFRDQMLAVLDELEAKQATFGLMVRKNIFDAMEFDFRSWSARLMNDVWPTLSRKVESGVKAGRRIMSAQGIGSSFDLLDPNVVRFIEERTADFARRFVTNVNDVTAEELRSTLQEGIELGEAIGDLKVRVRDVYDHASKARAEAIARTETKRASETGKRISYEKAGVTQIKWFSGPDACPFCQKLDGKVIDTVGGVFAKRGDTISATFQNADGESVERTLNLNFSDTPTPPLHPNCTCIALPVEETML